MRSWLAVAIALVLWTHSLCVWASQDPEQPPTPPPSGPVEALLPEGSQIQIPDSDRLYVLAQPAWIMTGDQYRYYRICEMSAEAAHNALDECSRVALEAKPRPRWWQDPVVIGSFAVTVGLAGFFVGVWAAQ